MGRRRYCPEGTGVLSPGFQPRGTRPNDRTALKGRKNIPPPPIVQSSLLFVCLHTKVDLNVVPDGLGAFDYFIPGKPILAALQIGSGFPPRHSFSLLARTLAQKL